MNLALSFLRLNIAKKILLGYCALSVVVVAIALFAVSNLEKLNRVNREIIDADVPLLEITDQMIDTLLAIEQYGRRYTILRNPETLDLFQKRRDEFNRLIDRIKGLPARYDAPIGQLISLSSEYNDLFARRVESPLSASPTDTDEYDRLIKMKQGEIIASIKKLSSQARLGQNEKNRITATVSATAVQGITLLVVISIVLGVGAALLITRNIAHSVNQLKLATREIAAGNFDHIPNVANQDELGELARAFGEMAKRLKRLEEIYLDTSPLTRLPGGIAIENVLKKRLSDGKAMAFCLLDLDNFKAFGDKYGYAKGSEVIKATARIIEGAIAEQGTAEDFVGHVGGDDFVIVTTPDRCGPICSAVIEAFDKAIPDFYESEDRQRGFILGKTRQGLEMAFPIMSISIGVVTNDSRELRDPVQIGEIAAELKEHAKSLTGSVYVVDGWE